MLCNDKLQIDNISVQLTQLQQILQSLSLITHQV